MERRPCYGMMSKGRCLDRSERLHGSRSFTATVSDVMDRHVHGISCVVDGEEVGAFIVEWSLPEPDLTEADADHVDLRFDTSHACEGNLWTQVGSMR
jgi:hypothetical protein